MTEPLWGNKLAFCGDMMTDLSATWSFSLRRRSRRSRRSRKKQRRRRRGSKSRTTNFVAKVRWQLQVIFSVSDSVSSTVRGWREGDRVQISPKLCMLYLPTWVTPTWRCPSSPTHRNSLNKPRQLQTNEVSVFGRMSEHPDKSTKLLELCTQANKKWNKNRQLFIFQKICNCGNI